MDWIAHDWFWCGLLVVVDIVVRALAASSYSVSDLLHQRPVHAMIEWPPYSPDLNPIKIVWVWLKEWITINYPDLINIGASEAAYQRLYEAM
jgi:hypothetical protein